jgi:7,8-dihydro-6-hydroxymethylpterin-pyrophosphokinase
MEETNDAVKDFPEFDAIENTVCDHLNWCLKEIRDFIGEREDTHLPVLTVSSLDETLPGDNLNFSFINPWLTSRAFLECLLVLLASPSTMMLMFAPTKDILLILLTFPAGLQYLQDNLTVVGALVSHLYQEAKEEDIPYNTVPPLNDLLKNADSVVCCPHYVGILIVYYMKVLGLMLNVKQLLKAGVELDDSRCLSALHTLYSITLSQAGRHCVASVMSMEGYSSILMPFIEPTGEAGHDLKLQKQFLSTRYVLLLLLQLVQESNIPPFFIKHTNEIITVGQFFKDNPSSSLSSIHKWTVPLNFLVQHHSNPQLAITPLMEFIMEESSQQGSFKSSKSMQPLLMALKLTWFLVSSAQHKQKQDPSGIRALQSVLELVSCDGLERLVTLLQKAVDTWMPFWRHHLVPTVSSQRCLVATVTLNLSLLKAIYLEFTKDSTFQLLNSNLLKTLFSLHMVFCISPVARVFSQVSDEIEVLVVDILSLYSCSVQETTSEDKEYAQDSWNMLLRELICIHMPSSPQSTLNGLSLLSQLLPLPLPIEMPKGVSAGEICELHASRHKWEVHLKPFLDDLFTILKYYMGSCSPELHFIVREVMVKLADLSSALALSMSNCILGVLSESLADTQSNSENALSKQTTIQVLSTLTVVVQQPSMKQALCEALYFKQSKFGHILASLLKFLKFNDLPNAENVKIYIISFLNTLCDMNVAFQLDSAALSAQTVANNVPPQNWLFLIVESAWSLMSDLHQPFTVTVCALKLLTSTAEYDQGIATLESVLKDDCLKFQLFVEHLISNLQAGGDTIKDVYQCTSFFLQFLLSLLFDIDSKRTQLHNASLSSNVPSTKLDGDTHADTNGSFSEDITSRELQEQYVKLEELKQIRSLTISAAWIRDALMPSDDKNFLQDLSVSVKEHCEDKQELSEFVQSVEEFVKSLSATIEERANTDIERVDQDMSSTFPGRAAIEEQFKERAFVVESSAGISSLDLWLTGPPVDEISFFDQCKVAVDLNQLAQDCCPNLNVEEEMKKQMLASPPHSPKHRFRKPKSNMLAERQRLRKEALLRQGPISGRGKDVFRSRKSTTSRAPSMHVDDFVKLGQQSRAAPSVGPYGLHPYMHGISGGPFMPSHLPTARSWSGIVPGQFRTQEIFLRVPQLTAGMRPGLR